MERTNVTDSWRQASPSLTPSRPAPPVPGQRNDSFSTSSIQSTSNTSSITPQNSSYSPSSFLSTPAQPGTSFSLAGSGAGSAQTIVRRGWVSVKEDGLRAWIWSKRWLVLREQTLTFYKNEVHLLSLSISAPVALSNLRIRPATPPTPR